MGALDFEVQKILEPSGGQIESWIRLALNNIAKQHRLTISLNKLPFYWWNCVLAPFHAKQISRRRILLQPEDLKSFGLYD